MFRSFMDELLIYLIENEIPHWATEEMDDFLSIFIFDKDAHKKRKKCKDVYVPYLRVSHFDLEKPYTRYNGVCDYMTKEQIFNIVDKLGGLN